MTEEEITNLGPIAQKFLSYPFSGANIDIQFGLNNKNIGKKI